MPSWGVVLTDNLEILSPAGDMQCFEAAVANGADAIYIGGKKFSARQSASNFDNEQLEQAVDYAHLRGVKVYVALNTLLHDSEIDDCFEFVNYCYNIGVDALIVQDLGLVNILRTHFPDFRIHASTQMTIHNSFGVKVASELGFERVVLSRELTYDEIKSVTDKNYCEIEVFAHGALCMCYSGQCLMSSFIGGRSGNRGACAQPCRLKYTICDEDKRPIGYPERYYMSLKDLCLVDEISQLKTLNVTSLKIEGRMKNSEYVAIVTSMYNKYRMGQSVDKDDISLLENVFSRSGFTKGYVKNNTGINMLNATKNNDDIYKNVTDDVHNVAKELLNNKRTTPVSVHVVVKLDEYPALTLKLKDFEVTAVGDAKVQMAQKSPTDAERIIKQVSKFGGTHFSLSDITSDIDDGINVPISVLNDLRRRAVLMAEEHIISKYKHSSEKHLPKLTAKDAECKPTLLSASVLTLSQAKAAYDAGFDRIYITNEVYQKDKAFFDDNSDIFALRLPPIIRESSNTNYTDINLDTVCIANISQVNLFEGKKLHADYTMNIYNSYALNQLANMGIDSACVSPELNMSQLAQLNSTMPKEILVYGRVPVMTVRNCLFKSANNKCGCNQDSVYYLLDRMGAYFPFMTHSDSCTNTVYNSVPIYMGDKMNQINSLGTQWHRFDFTTESKQEISDIVDMYKKGISYKNKNFTRGHYYRGVV